MISEMSITPFGDREALEELGARLKRARLQRNQTQAQLAGLASISRATYVKLEAGVGTVQIRVLARVLGLLGLANRLPSVIPDQPMPVDFDAVAKMSSRQRARPRPPAKIP
jgi:putative transcriptional regulator